MSARRRYLVRGTGDAAQPLGILKLLESGEYGTEKLGLDEAEQLGRDLAVYCAFLRGRPVALTPDSVDPSFGVGPRGSN